MVSIKFVMRSSSIEEHMSRIFIRIICRRTVRNVSTSIRLYPNEWDSKKQEIINLYNNPERIEYLTWARGELAADRQHLFNTINSLKSEGSLSSEALASAYRQYKQGNNLAIYVKKYSDALLSNGQVRTARAYHTTFDRFISFSGDPSITFEDITPRLLKNFESHLRDEGLTLNTISFYMRNLRAIYNKAIYEGIFSPVHHFPFKHVYTGLDSTRKRALSRKEMAILNDLECDQTTINSMPDRFKQALHLFLFSFHARGMAFVDMAYLSKENLHDGILSYRRKKTGQLIEMKVTDTLNEILQLFSSQTTDSPYLLPIITNKDVSPRLQYESGLRLQNKRLAALSRMLELDNKLTTHVARHSWASIAKETNLPLAVISEGLGHTSEKTTRIYLASFNRTILDKANEEVVRAIRHV